MAENQEQFLVIRLSSIGDIIHALPAVSALGESFPDAEIFWAVEPRYSVLLRGNPYIAGVIAIDTLGWQQDLFSYTTCRDILRSIRGLRARTYRAAVDFQGLWKSALLARVTGAGIRVGFAEYWLREPGAALFYTQQIAPRGRRHVIELNLSLVEALGAHATRWEFHLSHEEADECFVRERLASLGVDEFLIINPGGGWRAKCWSPTNYAELIQRLEKEFPGNILLTGSPSEELLIKKILAWADSKRACHFPCSLSQLVALVRRARLFFGGDTGPLHIAAAVGTPAVAIYGPTDPARNGPFSSADIILWNRAATSYSRRGKQARYIEGISVEAVASAVRERLTKAYG